MSGILAVSPTPCEIHILYHDRGLGSTYGVIAICISKQAEHGLSESRWRALREDSQGLVVLEIEVLCMGRETPSKEHLVDTFLRHTKLSRRANASHDTECSQQFLQCQPSLGTSVCRRVERRFLPRRRGLQNSSDNGKSDNSSSLPIDRA